MLFLMKSLLTNSTLTYQICVRWSSFTSSKYIIDNQEIFLQQHFVVENLQNNWCRTQCTAVNNIQVQI